MKKPRRNYQEAPEETWMVLYSGNDPMALKSYKHGKILPCFFLSIMLILDYIDTIVVNKPKISL